MATQKLIKHIRRQQRAKKGDGGCGVQHYLHTHRVTKQLKDRERAKVEGVSAKAKKARREAGVRGTGERAAVGQGDTGAV